MNKEELISIWKREEARPFTGWDFSWFDGKMLEDETPWSYPERAAGLLKEASAVLDMGTGGGERLLELRPYWPGKVVVTEDYPPNLQLAKERLEPLGVSVDMVELSDEGLMPYANGEFDLVLNRHSDLNCDEVARVLSPGGVFFTQQIHGLFAQDLIAEFGSKPEWPDATPEYYVPRLERAGLVIENMQDWLGELVFLDVSALVYYLKKAVPWTVPGFSVEKHADTLFRLEERLRAQGRLVFEARKYLIEARKAA